MSDEKKSDTEKKIEHKTEEFGGKAKEAIGKATDDEGLELQGKNDQTKSNIKQAGQKIKDAFKP
ncbi:CsbD family protein [Pseudonocardia endophytica]|uniref:CsbD-like protein n=1 Tax=Pseudonocardia endophytica TaxID=401976 RepID=A0A4R1HUA7_PSEEN|nr:CsbD family protein [Pseudonocardia endophytica]TCK21022.1 CsbD-like protein [Pseudonocardia endophytica]